VRVKAKVENCVCGCYDSGPDICTCIRIGVYAWNLRSFLLGGAHTFPSTTHRSSRGARLLSRVHFRPGATDRSSAGVEKLETTRRSTAGRTKRLFDFEFPLFWMTNL
jgi:hypothetical protein